MDLGVAEAFLEEVPVEGVGGYGAGAETGEDGGGKGDVADYLLSSEDVSAGVGGVGAGGEGEGEGERGRGGGWCSKEWGACCCHCGG